ncbi:unnamed protein product [Diatraea saccharalis]|uniref:HAT C-terminal dimerisation domain-containing protein n=1 Tax=Diatraea saccharalis TaxID=40085 RepID=A0A9N9QZW1_9NEOP|nr:unnamed protein product [Diatraea saccharalis]
MATQLIAEFTLYVITSLHYIVHYATLKEIVSALLCLPHSSATVERIFSSINLIKTKTRNHLGTDTMEGLLLTKQLLKNEPCFKLNVSKNMISKMNKRMYQQ